MIEDFYDESEPIIRFEDFYGPRKNLCEICIVLFSKVIYEHLLQMYDCRIIAESKTCNGDMPVQSFENGGKKIAFYLSPMGSSAAGAAIAEISHLTGAAKFIMFGSCGSLCREKTEGRFIIPTQAYRGEGMSHYFAPASDYIDIRNAALLEKIFSEMGIPYVCGKVWTTETMLRETVNLVKKRKEEGCIAVEMELAGVQAVCDYYGLELYDFLAAGDVLSEDSYDTSGLSDANHNIDKLKIAIQLSERI